MERNSQSTGFSQHWKTRFTMGELKSWLNKRVCVRGFFETHYENAKSSTDPAWREEDSRKARANTRTQRKLQRKPHYALKRAKHARHAEANHSLEQPKPLKDKAETKPRMQTWHAI